MQELLSLTLAGLAAGYLAWRCWLSATGRGGTACARCRACAAPAEANAGQDQTFVPVSVLQASAKKRSHA